MIVNLWNFLPNRAMQSQSLNAQEINTCLVAVEIMELSLMQESGAKVKYQPWSYTMVPRYHGENSLLFSSSLVIFKQT